MLSQIRKPLLKYGSWLASKRPLSSLLLANSFQASKKITSLDHRSSNFEHTFPNKTFRQFQTSSTLSIEDKKLLETLTPEFCQQLTGQITSKKFKLKSIQFELEKLYRKEFPLPESLTEEEWKMLMEFNSPDLRVYYLVI